MNESLQTDETEQRTRYPMPYTERLELTGILDPALLDDAQPLLREHSPAKDLLLHDRRGDLLIDNEFDLQTTINTLNAPALEVGGPTQDGFEVFEGISFPKKILISNLEPMTDKELHLRGISREDARLDLAADTRSLPFANESLGIVMAHGMTKHSEAVLSLEKYKQNGEKILAKLAVKGAIDSDEFQEEKESSRIGLLLESWRTLKEDGLLVLGSPDEQDLRLANALGFKLRAHTRLRPTRFDWSAENRSVPTEVILQKVTPDDTATAIH